MVFGKLFGGGEKKRHQAQETENFRRGLEAPMRALLDLTDEMPLDGPTKMLLRQKIVERDKGELEGPSERRPAEDGCRLAGADQGYR